MKTKGANKEKPERPDVAFWYPPADMTNAAFIQNSMALEKLGGRTQFVNLPEVEMADRMFGGHRQVSQWCATSTTSSGRERCVPRQRA